MSCSCRHEAAVLAAARRSSDAAVPEAVEDHLASCDDCLTTWAIAVSLQEERTLALAAARVPSAGQVWWRAELRARQDAAAAVARPITVATGLAAATLVGLLLSVLGGFVWWMRAWAGGVVAHLAQADATALVTGSTSAWLMVAVAAMLVAAPVVLYVASREE